MLKEMLDQQQEKFQTSQQQFLTMTTRQFNHQLEILLERKEFEYKFCG